MKSSAAEEGDFEEDEEDTADQENYAGYKKAFLFSQRNL